MTFSLPIYTSRSANLCYLGCPRDRFLSYEIWKGWDFVACTNPLCGSTFPGKVATFGIECALCGSPMKEIRHIGGITPKGKSIYLLVGECIHVGLEHIFEFARLRESESDLGLAALIPSDQTDHAVSKALRVFDSALSQGGVNFHKIPSEHIPWKIQEQRAMIEGLIRMAAITAIPQILERYKVLEVEKEDCFLLTPKIVFQSRLDCLLEDRDTNDLCLLSTKSAKEWGWVQEQQFRHDLQGISEAWEVERRLGRKVDSVQMLVLVKGREYERKAEWSDDSGVVASGQWVHYNPLTRAFLNEVPSIIPGEDYNSWAWSYDTMKTYVKGPKKGETYKGKLGKDWVATSTWDNFPGGMKGWVDTLAKGGIQPEMGDPFAGLIVTPEPWGRSQREIEDTLEQVTAMEKDIAAQAQVVNESLAEREGEAARQSLNKFFYQNRGGCFKYGGMCPNEGVCFGSLGLTPEDLVGVGKPWKLREGHHDAERGEG